MVHAIPFRKDHGNGALCLFLLNLRSGLFGDTTRQNEAEAQQNACPSLHAQNTALRSLISL